MNADEMQQVETATEANATMPEVESIPAALIWSLGGVALLLLLAGTGAVLLRYWESLHMGVQVVSLLIPVLLLWGGYTYAAKRGMRSGEVVGAFACISWLVALLIWHVVAGTPNGMVPGVLFIVGVLALAIFFPSRTSVVMLAVASVAEWGLLWYATTAGGSEPAGTELWAGGIALLSLWAWGGFACGLTRHKIYAPYAFLGPLMFSIYLLALQGAVLYLPPLPGMGWQEAGLILLIGLLPLPVFGAVHHLQAKRSGKPTVTLSSLTMMLAMFAALPVGLWASQCIATAVGALPLFAYAVCLVYYGSMYRRVYFISAGCILAFLSAFGIACGQGGSLLGGGITMFILGAAFLWLTCHFYRRRRQLQQAVILARHRQKIQK